MIDMLSWSTFQWIRAAPHALLSELSRFIHWISMTTKRKTRSWIPNGILSPTCQWYFIYSKFFSIEIKLFFDRFYLLKRQLLHSVLYSAAVPSSKLRVPVITLQYLVIIRSAVTFTHLSSSACLTFFGLINFVIFHDRVKLQTNYLQYKRKRAKYTKSAHTSNFQQKLSISTWCLPCQPVRANMFGPKKKI